MPNVGDLIKITSCSRILSQDACNVFYYVVAAWTGNLTLQDALEVWDDLVAQTAAGFISTSVLPGTVEWRNVDLPTEVASIVGGFEGAQPVGPVSAFAAYSVRQFVENASTRTGWKRIPGVYEAAVTDGVVNPVDLAGIQAWADAALAAPIEAAVPADMTLIPVVAGRNPDGTVNPTAINPITSAVAQSLMTTQNTRKVGRGA